MRKTVVLTAMVLTLLGTPVLAAPFLVGVTGPMSGSFADIGKGIEAGVKMAADAANAAGGVGGDKIAVVTADDKCDADTGTAVANQLVGKGVKVVIGHACTSAALAAAKVYAANGVLYLSPAATNPRLTDEGIGAGVFRLAVRSDLEAKALSDYLLAHFKDKRVAFVHDGSIYGQGLVEAVAKSFGDAGGSVAMTEAFTPGEKSQNSLVGKIQDAAVSAVVLGALQSDAAVISTALRGRGLDAAIIGDEALGLEDYVNLAGDAAEGTVFMLPDVGRDGAAAVDLEITLQEKQRQATDTLFASYAALQAAVTAFDGASDAADAAARLHANGADSVLGPLTFDAKGDWTGARYAPYVWKNGVAQKLE
ncbi:branched-chain amino acid ABC transporter substrate-binding protein [Oryzibacter oryziterrae]|uniref:branched-chain amino acid ABC transporter substrate-binding protein n=1 Tax=Oryzibacter oryziterrae TaxID=2766474 RepID=UPI001F178EA8|nr:branched-chain amino acid ABC transporter substrate-binding protein [Oryzibacter oryziterrae]